MSEKPRNITDEEIAEFEARKAKRAPLKPKDSTRSTEVEKKLLSAEQKKKRKITPEKNNHFIPPIPGQRRPGIFKTNKPASVTVAAQNLAHTSIEGQYLETVKELTAAKKQLADMQARIWCLEHAGIALPKNVKIKITENEAEALRRMVEGEEVAFSSIFDFADMMQGPKVFLSKLRIKLRAVGIQIIRERERPLFMRMNAEMQCGVRLLADKFEPSLSFPDSAFRKRLPPSVCIQDRFGHVKAELAGVRGQLAEAQERMRQLKEEKRVRDGIVELTNKEQALLIRLITEDGVHNTTVPPSVNVARTLLTTLRAKVGIHGIEIDSEYGGWMFMDAKNKQLAREKAHLFLPPLKFDAPAPAPMREAAQANFC